MKAAARILALTLMAAPSRADMLELANGNKVEGRVIEENAEARALTVEFTLGSALVKRTVPFSAVKAITVNGVRRAPGASGAAPAARTPAEVQALIDKDGSMPPGWLKGTRSNHPKSLDLSWPEKPQGGWDNQKNVGQFIWDVINPNQSRWREGVRLMQDLLDEKPGAELRLRVMKELANMHFRFFQDYARAAWWWQRAGITVDDPPGSHLAECYWRLGSKQMALDFMSKAQFLTLDAVKLLGDMLETDRAVAMAEQFAEHDAWLLAGDACRVAGRLSEARAFYEKTVSTPVTGQRAERAKRTQGRAQASLEALKLYELADVSKAADGTYKDSSLGYEAQVEVTVKVRGRRIEDVKVTQHREKQYYSALTDVPAQIIAKQGVRGVEATSRATITGEAIINAAAKALAKGSQ